MSKQTIKWLLTAICLCFVGCMVFGTTLLCAKGDFSKMSTSKFSSIEFTVNDEYSSISIFDNTANIEILPSEDNETKVVLYENDKIKHNVFVKDNTLIIEFDDTRKWYEHIEISFENSNVTLYLPEDKYGKLCINGSTGNVSISEEFLFEGIDVAISTGNVTNYASSLGNISLHTSTGKISLLNVSADCVDLSVSTGKVTVKSVDCKNSFSAKTSTGKADISDVDCSSFSSCGSTGDIRLSDVVSKNAFNVERSTGDVSLEKCDGGEIEISTDTGNVKGSLLSEKVFITNTNTGRVNVPETTSGGKCKINTNTGDISITIE